MMISWHTHESNLRVHYDKNALRWDEDWAEKLRRWWECNKDLADEIAIKWTFESEALYIPGGLSALVKSGSFLSKNKHLSSRRSPVSRCVAPGRGTTNILVVARTRVSHTLMSDKYAGLVDDHHLKYISIIRILVAKLLKAFKRIHNRFLRA